MEPTSQQTFIADQYAPRAQSYVTSAVHRQGADLDQIAETLRAMPAARLLDLGCGGGHVSYCAAPHVAEVVAADITQAMLDVVQRTAEQKGIGNISTRIAAAEALPFADASFDAVISRFSAHHWGNLEAGMREARRVLKPGGLAMLIDIVAPADPLLDMHLQSVELLRDPSHVRDYDLAEWVAALGRANFRLQGLAVRRLRMEFDVWTARTDTPALRSAAIRALQTVAPDIVRSHFAIGPDGSFDIDSATFTATSAESF